MTPTSTLTARLATAARWLLDPAKRRALYGVLAGVGTVVATAGLASEAYVTGVVGVAVAAVDCAAILMASVRARRGDWTAIYAGMAAVVAALQVAGWATEAHASWSVQLIGRVVAVVALVAAMVRTDPSTPTGEPAEEYQAREAPGPESIS